MSFFEKTGKSNHKIRYYNKPTDNIYIAYVKVTLKMSLINLFATSTCSLRKLSVDLC